MSKFWFSIGCVLLALSVGIGAFGAHGLKTILEANNRIETFETAVKYQFYHSFGIVILSLISKNITTKMVNPIGWLFLGGIIVFSGSLYILSLSGIRWLGAITPLGGVSFILAWLLMAFSFKKIFRA